MTPRWMVGLAALRRLYSATVICVVGGLVGGLALGYALSRQGAWLTPAPWAVYLVALLAAIGAVTWLDERRRGGMNAVAVAPEGAAALALPDTDAVTAEALPEVAGLASAGTPEGSGEAPETAVVEAEC